MRFILAIAILGAIPALAGNTYFPPSDGQGGWRRATKAEDAERLAGIDVSKLDRAFDYMRRSTSNGGLLVVRHGWLVYERYFGRASRTAAPNLASCAKAFTSVAVGIVMAEHPDLFPHGLDQKVFTRTYFPDEAFPLSDPRRADIRLGQLLSMTAGIRGNLPAYVYRKPVQYSPPGPDGWRASVDEMAYGKQDGKRNTRTLWTQPGGGFSYATSSAHLASIIVRRLSGMELEEFIRRQIGGPLGWSDWGWGYKYAKLPHTPGGGGIALRGTDLLRFAYLLLHQGSWSGKQIVPRSYVLACGRPTKYNPHTSYSLQFDVNAHGKIAGVPHDAYWKAGSGYHCFYIVPSLDLVAVKLGGRDGQYTEADTGLKEPASVRAYTTPRDWKPRVSPGQGWLRTLELIVAAVRDK